MVYPGAAPETGSQATDFYPDAPRASTVIRKCDLRLGARLLGLDGQRRPHHARNHIYGNMTGISSDTLGRRSSRLPADSSEIDHNYIYSNNLDLYTDRPPVAAAVPVPIGTGIIYPGMNDARVHHNWIFDNWRDGTMLFAVPTPHAAAAPRATSSPASCPGAPANGLSTSCGNRFFRNRVGRAPKGFSFPGAIDMFGNAHTGGAGQRKPNGNDFWWSEFFPGNTGNCWFGNTGPDGTAASVTGPGNAGRSRNAPQVLPSTCATSVGNDDVAKLSYLVDCGNGPDDATGPTDCDWWTRPARPGSPAALNTVLSRPRRAGVREFAWRRR